MRKLTLAFAGVLTCATVSGAQPTLRGRIVGAKNALPIAGAVVTVTSGRDTLARARSDSTGEFAASVTSSPAVVVHFAAIGFRPDSIAATIGDLPLRVAMVPYCVPVACGEQSPIALSPVVVRDTARTGFERRARRNAGGIFLRLADIEKAKPVRTSDLFRSLAGVAVQPDSVGTLRVFSLRTARPTAPQPRATVTAGGDTIRAPATDARRCAIRVGVDGRLMPPDFTVDDLRPSDIAAIEAYSGAATMPIEFSSVQRDSPCGIVMLWTRTGAER